MKGKQCFFEQVRDLGGLCSSCGLTKEKDNHIVCHSKYEGKQCSFDQVRDLGGLCTSCGLTQKLSQVVATARTSNGTTSPRDLLRDCFNSSKFSHGLF